MLRNVGLGESVDANVVSTYVRAGWGMTRMMKKAYMRETVSGKRLTEAYYQPE